jgi:hypothetical protein
MILETRLFTLFTDRLLRACVTSELVPKPIFVQLYPGDVVVQRSEKVQLVRQGSVEAIASSFQTA